MTVARYLAVSIVIVLPAGGTAAAQTPLTLDAAMTMARTAAPDARQVDAASAEASARVRLAQSAYLPRVELSETVERSNQPVFAFGTLLGQQRFTAEDFALDRLNRPAAVSNLRTGLRVEQLLFDAGSTYLAIRDARLGRDAADADARRARADLALGAARAFVDVLRLEGEVAARRAAVEAAETDLQRAQARRDIGLATDADVLEVDVHLADMRERALTTEGDLEIARLRLHAAIGAPLDSRFALVPPSVEPAPANGPDLEPLIADARVNRPDARLAALRVERAANGQAMARSLFLPRLSLVAGWEANGRSLTDQRPTWLVGATVRLSLSGGIGEAARIEAARQAERSAAAARDGLGTAIEVEIRSAAARLRTARERAQVGATALERARESQRIIRDRYESGLATVGDVLRAAEHVLDAESRALAAQLDAVLQELVLDHAAGRL